MNNEILHEGIFLAETRTGNDVIIYAFVAKTHTTLTPKEQFQDIILNQGWEPFDEVVIHSLPSTPRAGLKTVYRGSKYSE